MNALRLVLHCGVAAIALAAAVPACAQTTPAHAPAVASAPARAIVAGDRLDRAAVDRFARQALVEGTDAAAVFDALAADSALAPAQRANARRAAALVLWRGGDLDGAAMRAQAANAIAASHDGEVLQGDLALLRDDPLGARMAYERARDLAISAPQKAALARRLALLDPGVEGEPVVDLAEAGVVTRQSAAQVLALDGYAAAAERLGSVTPEAATLQGALMLAEQALKAGDTTAAARHAWQALDRARTAGDRRYALALLAESAPDEAARKALASRLAGRTDVDSADARIALLLRGGDYGAARALLADRDDAAARDMRIEIDRITDDRAAIAEEFSRTIAARPRDPDAYVRLALLHLANGEEAQALEVFDRFFASAPPPEAQIEAARAMIGMGLDEAAIARIRVLARNPSVAIAAQLFLFDAFSARGDDAAARATLDRLAEIMPRGDAMRAELADAYERLGDLDAALAVLDDLSAQGLLDYDHQVHVADLLEQSGQDDAALATWRKLWRASELPARRSFLETRIVRLGKRTGQLDTLAGDAERELAASGSRSALALVVAIRLAEGERAQARDAITRFAASAGLNEQDRLRELVAIHARTGDYAALDDALRRLAQLDAEHADIYLRQRILAVLAQPGAFRSADDQQAAIDGLIAQLDAASAQASGSAEAASRAAAIYELASLHERAISSYRRAVALSPDRGDDLMQLTKILAGQERGGEALAVASYALTMAPDAASRAVAADALMGASRGQGGEAPVLAQRMNAALRFLRLRLLDEVLGGGGDLDLYAQIADVAAAGGVLGDQLRATEMLLPAAGGQRADILRRLVAMADPAKPGADGTTADPEQRAVYGQRLIALGVEFPPETYAEIGTALLAVRKVSDAARAFAMMGDLGGLVNTDEIRARAYAAVGRYDQALDHYALALLRDRRNPGLIVATSILREAMGQERLAHDWYADGLASLIVRQAATGEALDPASETGLDVRRFYATLVEGLVATMPAGAAGDATMQRLVALVRDAAAARVAGAGYASHVRLRLAADAAWRIAAARGDAGAAAQVQAALSEAFPADLLAQRELAYRRHLTSLPQPDAVAIDEALAVQARDSGNVFLAAHLALARLDREWLAELLAQVIADDADERARPLGEGPPRPPRGLLVGFVLDALEALPAEAFRAIVWTPIPPAQRSAVAFDILNSAPSRYDELEAAIGESALDHATMIDRIASGRSTAMPLSVQSRRGEADAADGIAAMIGRFSTDETVTLYERLVERGVATGIDNTLARDLFGKLVMGDLDEAQRQRVIAAVERQAGSGRGAEDNTAAWFAPTLLIFDAPAANREVLLAGADALARRFADGAAMPQMLRAWYADDRATALALLRRLHQETRTAARTVDYLPGIEQRWFAEEANADVDRFLARAAPSPAEAAAFYTGPFTEALGRDIPDALVLRVFERLVAIDPANGDWVSGLLLARRALSEPGDTIGLLQDYLARVGGDRGAGMALAAALLLRDDPGDAAQAEQRAAAAGTPLDDAAAWTAIATPPASLPRSGMTALASVLLADLVEARPQAALARLVANPAAGVADPQYEPAGAGLAREVLAGGSDVLRDLRMAWRRSAQPPEPDSPVPTLRREDIAQGLAEAGLDQSHPAFSPEVSELVVTLLSAIGDKDRGGYIDLYRAAGRGLAATGQPAEVSEDASPHAVLLALAVAEAGGGQVPVDSLLGYIERHPGMLAGERLYFARILGMEGQTGTASRLVRDAALQVRFMESDEPVPYPGRPAVVRPDDFIHTLACWPDHEAAQAAYQDVASTLRGLIRGPHGGPGEMPDLPACTAPGGAR
ncbi:hypothetical protein D2V17_01490 [Aurantiacibacter xanthus]|uniref:Tetratricopeptide repeat protein n=1 Tax=Aurantiacibacter xanthus TaxID=1784712 RepID=A0A3A1PG33_9SPHN|nr:hypothetical protein [Aurantiacibacter xanthus]RIV92807.1 hypothetical protein D2V17_01490 [Aurantiacibacter xanthus]